MAQQISKWCPECEQFQLHVGLRCTGCDISESEFEEMLNGESSDQNGSEAQSGSVSKEKLMEQDWVVVKGTKPVFSAGTKKECTAHVAEEIGQDSISTSRIAPGLYVHESSGFFVGRPEALLEEGRPPLLTLE